MASLPTSASESSGPTPAQERTLTARFAPELGANGAVVRLAGTVMDDTDRLAADLERRTAESRFEVAFEQAGIGTGILGLDGIPTRVNAAGCAILAGRCTS